MSHSETASYPDISSLLEQGMILTANDRLARQLRLFHAEQCQAAGQQAWPRPAILSWSMWLQQCVDELLDVALATAEAPPLILSPQQSEAVWQQIIDASQAGASLLQAAATASAAQEAWDLLCGWRVPLKSLEQSDHEDIAAFAGWVQDYQARSQHEGWLDHARLADYIRDAISAGKVTVPGVIYLAGFEEPRPQQQKLFESLSASGCDLRTLAPAVSNVQVRQYACADSHAEIRAAAGWCRQQLEQDVGLCIGVVVHDLAGQRDAISRVFDEVLCAAVRLPQGGDERPYNISLGRPLAETPLVRDALLALELAAGPVSWTSASALLRSPFFTGTDSESEARARIDARLRRQGREQVSLRDLRFHAEQAGCPQLLRAIDQCQSLREQLSGSAQSAAIQAGHVSEWLKALGWSHGRPLSSAEYQTVRAWWELLAEFATLEAVGERLSWRSAVARLRRLAGARLFQPQSASAPVQIMGLLEAAGMQFDRLWVMGLHDAVWPASPRPHPFIPIHLQSRYGLPHATAERELEFATHTTERLLSSAPQVIVSWPQREGDAELRPSPLLADIPPLESLADIQPPLAQWLYQRAPSLDDYDDTPPPPLQPPEAPRGGTAILRNQAACPFRAFAQHRLQAEPLEEPVPGLDAAGRGALVHEVMRAIWGELRSQEHLLQLDAEAQAGLVSRCVETALGDWEQKNLAQLPPRFRALEQARLQALASDWLQLDRGRTAFTVEARESEQVIDIAGLELKGRIDRLDQLPDGQRLIIDYKTGRVDPRVWLDERPDDPQLPLYALGHRDRLAGIAFAQLRIGDIKYAGVADREDVAPGIKPITEWQAAPADCDDLPSLLEYWQDQLSKLSCAFQAGESQVDPKDPRRTCRYCPQPTLCRIDELSHGGHDLEEGDD